jgi:hypothetical protein
VGRSHRIDGEEFYRQLKGVVSDGTQLFNDKLQEWLLQLLSAARRLWRTGTLRTPPPEDHGHDPCRKRSTSVLHDGAACDPAADLRHMSAVDVRQV